MKSTIVTIFSTALILAFSCQNPGGQTLKNDDTRTVVGIKDSLFYINNKPTYEGRTWNGYKIEGLLMNSRMVQGIFDDLNEETVSKWKYPDTGEWDAERNTNEFVDAMDEWHSYGLLSFTINMQGGSPMGYGNQNWYNSAYYTDGSLRMDYMARLERILDNADSLGMVPMLGLFYFGQDQNLDGDTAAINAVKNTLDWLFDKGYKNVLIELANEADNKGYDIEIIKAGRVHELMEIVRNTEKNGYRFLVGCSYNGGSIPKPNVVKASDFILLHGNGVKEPDKIAEMVRITRGIESYKPMPIVFNEDDHYDFDKEWNNMEAAISEYASWGYFDFRRDDDPFEEGFQSVPVDWRVNTQRKKAFFEKVKEITGY